MTSHFESNHVKILIRTEQIDGYPAEEWEGLWAIPTNSGQFIIDNIPFYARNLSCGDIVEAALEGEDYIFKRVAKASTNSTIRVIIYDLKNEEIVRKQITELGCSIEGTGTPGLIAVNVPSMCLERIVDMLEEEFAKEILDFEEAALR